MLYIATPRTIGRLKMKYCYSKGSTLVLLWIWCVCAAMWFSGDFEQASSGFKIKRVINLILVSTLFLVSAPLSGYLADSRFGNFRVFKTGAVLMFFGCVSISVAILVLKGIQTDSNTYFVVSIIAAPISNVMIYSGGGACLATSFQLGLDQMPDTSSTDILSFLKWYVVTVGFGFWVSNFLCYVVPVCFKLHFFYEIVSLFPVFCVCIVLCTLFIFGQKVLIIEPQSTQAFRNVYRVLKFAAKHTSPVNRSAFTYWEENIPSRLDLGKSRFGGPFTTEQVEDVKTFGRLLIVFVPIWVTIFSISVYGVFQVFTTPLEFQELPNSTCVYSLFSKFTYSPWWCGVITILLYKFIVYPVIRRIVGSIMRQITIVVFLVMFLNIANSTFSIVVFVQYDGYISLWSQFVYIILSSSAFSLCWHLTTELVCAQSPYNMRGLLSGYVFCTLFLFHCLGSVVSVAFCHSKNCVIGKYCVGAGLGILGALLQSCSAVWYKTRERDQQYDLYRHIATTYDTYISQEEAQRQ